MALAFLIVGLPAAWNLSSWPARLRYPGELNDIEGMRLAEMVHLRRGVPIYAPAEPERFDAAIYGPLYYLLGARIIDPHQPTYRSLRLVSLLGTLGCAAGGALLAYWLAGSFLAAGLSALLFLGYGIVTRHGLSARSDLVALFLVFSGFLVAYRFRSTRLILLSAPLMLAGLFYKPQFEAAPAAVFIFLILEKRYRLAAQFAAVLALGGLGLLGLFQYAVFAGQDFILHVVAYNRVPFSWGEFAYGILAFGLLFGIPLLVGLEYLRRHPVTLPACYVACLIPFSLLIKGREGSDFNYFIEAALLLSCLFAALLAEEIARPARAAELIVLAGITAFIGQRTYLPAPGPEDVRRDRAIQNFLRGNFPPGTKAYGHYAGDLVRAGLETPISDIWQYSALVQSGRLPADALEAQVRDKIFGVIILTYDLQAVRGDRKSFDVVNARVRGAILEGYRLVATLPLPRPEMQNEFTERFEAWVPRAGPSDAGRRLSPD